MKKKTIKLTELSYIDALVAIAIYSLIGNSRYIMMQLTKISLAAGLRFDTGTFQLISYVTFVGETLLLASWYTKRFHL